MTVVFDTEPLVAVAFDEPGAAVVADHLDEVYDGDRRGYVTAANLAEFRYVAARERSPSQADDHLRDLLDAGITVYTDRTLWDPVSAVKLAHNPALGDAYALAAARRIADTRAAETTLLVGADDDYDGPVDDPTYADLIERFRTEAA